MPSFTLQINHDGGNKELTESSSTDKFNYIKKLNNFFKSVDAGLTPAVIEQVTSATALVRASGTLTVASINANDTCVINGTTLTAKASPSGTSEFLSAGTDTVVAAAVAACINANTSFTGLVTATSSGAIVTVSAVQSGVMGNMCTLVGTATRFAASVSRLAGGTGNNGAVVSYSCGK
jgi:hypothetical protein